MQDLTVGSWRLGLGVAAMLLFAWSLPSAFAAELPVSSPAEFSSIPTIAALRANKGDLKAVKVLGYWSPGDGGEGVFLSHSDSTASDNGGTVIIDAAKHRWDRQYNGPVDARWFGIKCDNVTDNSPAILGLNQILRMPGVTVNFPEIDNYLTNRCLTSSALVPGSQTSIASQPKTFSLSPKPGSSANPLLIDIKNAKNVRIFGLTLDGNVVSIGSSNPLAAVYRSDSVVFDGVSVQNSRGIGIIFSTEIKNSGVLNSEFNNVGNYWKVTFNASDRHQAIVFCCASNGINELNYSRLNKFFNVGLDSISLTNQNKFKAERNSCNNNMQENSILKVSDYPACIYGSDNDGVEISENKSDNSYGNGIDFVGTKNLVILGNVISRSGAAGIGIFSNDANVVLSGNTLIDNVQWPFSPFKGGISISGNVNDIKIIKNISTDDQAKKTQLYGVQNLAGASASRLSIDPDNVLHGNGISDTVGVR